MKGYYAWPTTHRQPRRAAAAANPAVLPPTYFFKVAGCMCGAGQMSRPLCPPTESLTFCREGDGLHAGTAQKRQLRTSRSTGQTHGGHSGSGQKGLKGQFSFSTNSVGVDIEQKAVQVSSCEGTSVTSHPNRCQQTGNGSKAAWRQD